MSKQAASTTKVKPPPNAPPDDADRRRIVQELDTTMLVEAAAGTGKTTSMVGRMIALLREGKCRIDTLAAVTFTRKSTAELRARFQVELERAVAQAAGPAQERLAAALLHVERCFIGTIHSFCGRLLRERPMEAGVDLAFQELDEAADAVLRNEAWDEYVARLYAENSPVLAELDDLGLEMRQLRSAFIRYANYPDVDDWPAPEIELSELDEVVERIEAYAADMEQLIPTFPRDRGNDALMNQYERIPRLVRQRNRARQADALAVVAEFRDVNVVQKQWPGGAPQGKREKLRWEEFVRDTAEPLQRRWLARRYATVMRVFPGAMEVYDRLRGDAGGLNFQDLLQRAAALLRDKANIRRYFRQRFTHLLVDEFQDTDPIQAEVLLLLTSDNGDEPDWRNCRPAPGAMFVVGDPKQSIYRFRRADIQVYTQVKKIILAAGGVVIPLTANFRTIAELVQWGNQVFDTVFPAVATDWSPAACPMLTGRQGEAKGSFQGLHVLRVPATHTTKDDVLEFDADCVARTIRHCLDMGLSLPRTPDELARGVPPNAVPGDFLIVTRMKKHLALYAKKLGELGIPHQVTGGAALGDIPELALLSQCLTAVLEPENPVALVAVLRGELFGLSDTDLYAFRRAGGRFDYRHEIPSELSVEPAAELSAAFTRLRRYRLWLRQLPPIAAIERMASDLGLPMRAAATVGGDVQAGGLAKALEMLRVAQNELNSTTDLVDYLDRLIDENGEFDSLPAQPPQAAAVRLMNLHKVKGLEAPVVFLADPTGVFDHEIDLHINRAGDRVQGSMVIYDATAGQRRPVVACPLDSGALFAVEKQFQTAEELRLQYVAATRAGVALVVAQRAHGNKKNPWAGFEPYLQNSPDLPDPGPQVRPVTKAIMVTGKDVTDALADVTHRWDHSATTSYALAAAKELSLAPSRIHFHAVTGEHGTEWGTVIHLLLETALARPGADLHELARQTLVEEGLDASEADNAVGVVGQVLKSDILQRAKATNRYLVEVPFQQLLPAGSARAVDGLPTIVRGVIDLAFWEEPGWVIVDYKTDRIAPGQLPNAAEHYRSQVATYAEIWSEIVRQPIHEFGLYFTHVDRYVRL